MDLILCKNPQNEKDNCCTDNSIFFLVTMSGSHDQRADLASPGRGWSNGDMKAQMFSFTREGKLQLYSSQRRWLHLAHGWSRIGAETGSGGKEATQFSRRVSFSNKGTSIVVNAESEARTVRSLIAQLCERCEMSFDSLSATTAAMPELFLLH